MEPVALTTLPEVKTVFINETDVTVWRSAYMDNEMPALFLTDVEGDSVAVATVNLSGYGIMPQEQGNTFIKNYGENEGILDVLVKAGVISEPVRTVPCGFAVAHECRIL